MQASHQYVRTRRNHTSFAGCCGGFSANSYLLDRTKTGDISEVSGVAEDSAVWPSVTSTAGNCLGKHCQYARECFVTRARLRAQKANVIVVNHHLFLSAAAMELEGGQDDGMLPRVDAVIFDEAHKLPEIATNYFGSELSTTAIREVVESMRPILMGKFKVLPQGNLVGCHHADDQEVSL